MVKRKNLMCAVMYAVGKKELILRHSIDPFCTNLPVYLAFVTEPWAALKTMVTLVRIG